MDATLATAAVAAVNASYADLLKSKGGASWLNSDAQDSTAGDIRALGPVINAWAGRQRAWAEAGQRDDGTSYDWGEWADMGNVIQGDLETYGANFTAGGLFATIKATAIATATTVEQGAKDAGGLVASPMLWQAVGLGVAALAAWKIYRVLR